MKIKPTSKTGGVVVELGPKEPQLPSISEQVSRPLPLFKVKKIVVPVDFSVCASKALQYAIAFARQFKAELALVHVVPPHPPVPEMAPVDVETIDDGRKQLVALRKGLDVNVPATTLVRVGEPAREIVAAAAELGADLIIISTHGRTGLAHVLLGSTTERVVRHAACPVLVVRERQTEFIDNN